MKKYSLSALVLCLALLSGCGNCGQNNVVMKAPPITAGEDTQVKTVYGPIEGYLDGGIYTFKGIRYAKAERFMPPQEPDTFTELRQCKLYGPKAPQGQSFNWNDSGSQTDYSFGNQFVLEPMNEDACLVLNVWTPSITDGKKRSVFMWIHGGGYSSGSAHDLPCYEGRALAEKGDIVVVSINHRLNVLGYLDLTALGGRYSQSVNLGMQDIVKALEWANKNIDRFGGNPDDVTIGGQSGGGGKVSTLLAMPSAKGLFKKAIVQSGSTLSVMESENSRQIGLSVLEKLGVDPAKPEKLASFTYEELAAAGRGTRFSPTVDGTILPQQPFDPVASEVSRDVPMLIGTDFNEFTFDIEIDLTPEEIHAQLAERMGQEKAEKYIEEFWKAYPDGEAKEMLYIDLNSRSRAVKQAAAKSVQGGADAYLYLFTWKPTANALGASHGMELPFMLNNVALQREMTGSSEEAYIFEDVVASTWLSFIKTGNPNNPKIPTWEPYNEETGVTMILDNECRVENHHDRGLIELTK